MGAGLQSIGLLPLWQQILYGTCLRGSTISAVGMLRIESG